jgi:glycine/D-amino acid oxidase-like deaminating enzyme
MERYDAIIIGGGLVGSAIAYGLAGKGLSCALLDEGDVAYRASRGNFGLVWVQSKGLGAPHYQRWSRLSADEWPGLAAELRERVEIEIGHERPGGVHLCLSEEELANRTAIMAQMKSEAGNFGFDYRMLSPAELRDMLPGVGPAVIGGSYTSYDGHANPLYLLHALHKGLLAARGVYRPGAHVTAVDPAPNRFRVVAGGAEYEAGKVVLAAGLGNAELAPRFGLSAPVKPLKGQILVTERAGRVLPMPTTTLRQTVEGSLMMGDSHEDVGFDTGQNPKIMHDIARRNVLAFPWLKDLQVIRAWAALRVMSPDGLPIYDQSERFPGAFTANCHSGVTLAAAHARALAPMIASGELDPMLAKLTARRLDVPAAA